MSFWEPSGQLKLGLDPRALSCQPISCWATGPRSHLHTCSSQTLCLGNALHTGWGLMDPNQLSVDLRRETFLDKPLRGLQESKM